MVQVPSIDADLEVPQARRDESEASVMVILLMLLFVVSAFFPLFPLLWEGLLSTSTVDVGDVLSNELSAGAFSSSSSSF